MIIYEYDNGERGVIYDDERQDLIPQGANWWKVNLKSVEANIIRTCTIGELQTILGLY